MKITRCIETVVGVSPIFVKSVSPRYLGKGVHFVGPQNLGKFSVSMQTEIYREPKLEL